MNGTPIAPIVTAITVARLHNLGNYEHVRYEVSVAIPDGAKPSQILADVTAILGDLKPARIDEYDLARARKLIATAPTVFDANADWEDMERDQRRREEAQRVVDRAAVEERRLLRARAALDVLGGERTYTDAKRDWDDEDQL